MGWCSEDGSHEGYLAGLVRTENESGSIVFKELGYPRDEVSRDLGHVQVACTCGWRSSRLHAPLGTTWSPYIVLLPRGEHDDASAEFTIKVLKRKPFEAECFELWKRHIEEHDASAFLKKKAVKH